MEAEKNKIPDASTVQSDLESETLSGEEREEFLRAWGIRPGVSAEEAARVRAKWPDSHILMVINSGQY